MADTPVYQVPEPAPYTPVDESEVIYDPASNVPEKAPVEPQQQG